MVVKQDDKKSFNDKGLVRVFVYGTLKQGHHNHRLLENSNAVFLGYDTISGLYRMYSMGGFPAVLDFAGQKDATGTQRIHGEVWAMGPEGLASLDLLEGNPHFYARRKLWTDGLQKRAWVYFLNESWIQEMKDEDLIPENIWEPKEDEEKYWSANGSES